MERTEYQVIVVFENDDYFQTYFKAVNKEEIITHYNGYTMEYYNGETTKVWALDIKNMEAYEREVYYYEGI